MPDQFVMSKDEYYGYFPYDVYKDEDQKNKWPLGEKVADITDSTNVEWGMGNGNNSLAPGWYKIVATTRDKYGEEVKAEKFILVQGEAATGRSRRSADIVVQQMQEVAPGQKINMQLKPVSKIYG